MNISSQNDTSDFERYNDFDVIVERLFSQIPEDSYQTDFNLSKSLYWVHPDRYFGQGNKGDTIVGEVLFKSLYISLYNSQRVGHLLPSLEELEMSLEDYIEQNQSVPLIVLDISYDEMYLDALENGWLELIDTMIVPVGNHPLFKKKEVLAAIPYWGSSNMDLPLVWDSQFVFSNSLQQSPESFRLILGKEKYKTDELSQLMIGDVQSGRVFWNGKSTTFQLEGKQVQTKSGSDGFPSPTRIIKLSGTYTFGDFTWYNELGLWQGCQQIDGRIRKPVLIVEGFDPFNDRNLDPSAEDIVNMQAKCKEDNHLYWASNDEGLADELREQGYDVLILNFANGSGELHQNAMTVIEAINYINQHKITNNELVVIGPSMGGLLARYALAYMEENNMEHYTKLFLSFDAPHQGANVCLGVQHAMRFMLNSTNVSILQFLPSAMDYVDKFNQRLLDAPATKQMLLYHHSQTGGLSADSDPMFQQFQQNLHNLNFPHDGYPVKCKKIAISNGSAIGQEQYGFNEGDNLFTFTGYVPNPILPTTLYLRYNALPDHSFKTIFSGYTNIMLFGVLPVSLNIAIKSVNNTDALDNAPAGTQVFHSQTFNNLIAHPISFFNDPCTENPQSLSWGLVLKDDRSKDAFVPTISALDLQNTNDWRYNFFTNHQFHLNNYGAYVFLDNLVTPFDEVYVNFSNDPHVITSLDAFSGNWANNEIGPYNMKLQNHIVSYDTDYEAVKTIEVGRNVTTELNSGDFILTNDTYTDFLASESIEFFPGFDSDGGTMLAHLGDISCNIIKSTTSEPTSIIGQIDRYEPKNEIVKMILDNESEIRLYPNPTSDYFTVSSSKEVIDIITITNISGQIVGTINVNNFKSEISVRQLPKGIYIINIITNQGVHTDRIILE